MATLKDASQSIRKGDWAATIDLKDAYLHVPIARVTKGSSGSGGKAEVSVPSSPIQFCSSDFHDDQPASCGYVKGKGDSIDSLFGRFPGVGSELEAVDFSHQYSIRLFRPGWIPAKLEEMSYATQTEVRIRVPAVGLEDVASDASGGQDQKIFVDYDLYRIPLWGRLQHF